MTVLFDFETTSDFAAWHDEGRTTLGEQKTVERAQRWATSGDWSLRFATPKWRQGLLRWPAFEGRPTTTDWRGFDRLVYDVTNATAFPQRLGLFITDGKVATRKGLQHSAVLPPQSHALVVVPLADLAGKQVNAGDIQKLHFFTSDPPGDMDLYLDRLALLRKDEPLPSLPAAYIKQVAALQGQRLREFGASVETAAQRLRTVAAGSAPVLAWIDRELAEVREALTALDQVVSRGEPAALETPAALVNLQGRLARVEALTTFRLAFEPLRPAVTGPAPQPEVAVGFATSMEKVLPRAVSTAPVASATASLALARNEVESLQVLVVPFERALQQVRVEVGDLAGPNGAVFPASAIQTAPMGYVETKAVPPYGSTHVGWWPDPILGFLRTADIAQGDVQSFWVRAKAPKTQAPGAYRGHLVVRVGQGEAFHFDLNVQVYPFTMPDRSPLPLAITFSPGNHPLGETKELIAARRKDPNYPPNAWRRHRLEWGDFLADYYITYDSLYHHAQPDFEILSRLKQQGRLGRYNLGYYGAVGSKPGEVDRWKQATLPRLRQGYDQAKQLGLLDQAYIYGCDEAPKGEFDGVQRAAELLRAEFPGVTIMTTTYDHSYGQESVIRAMDAFCPLTPVFDGAKAAAARAAGKQVWWYICCGPHPPHANMFIECPAIDGRLLMGALTARHQPDGFLYYQISIWNSAKPITSGPFTDWDPRSWTTYHGDGSWTCVGPDGTPLPTIRLENFRDGLEDYAYWRILKATIAKAEAKGDAAWLARARALLTVPDDLARSRTELTRDPAVLYRYRRQLAEAISTAPVPAAEL